MGKPNKPKEQVDQKDAELAAELGLTEQDVTEQEIEETEEEVQASAVLQEQPAPEESNTPETTDVPAKVVPATAETIYANGQPAFRRLAATAAPEAPKKLRPRPATQQPTKRVAYEPSANPVLLTFPTDRWGVTKDLKKALINVASRVAGDPNKKELVDETLKILVLHLNAKFKADQSYKQQLLLKNKSSD